MAPEPRTDPEDDGYELVMPFVTVASKGGPHDDVSYTAGWAMGELDRTLALLPDAVKSLEPSEAFEVANLPQMELIAMRYGWDLSSSYTACDEEWTFVTFERAEVSDG